VLAVAYHLASVGLQRRFGRRGSGLAPVVTILGFLLRLTLLVVILAVLALWTPLNVLAVCLAFIGLFTVLTGFFLYSMISKRRGAPPSAGASGVH
jgi:CDP-diglyceride synthetase